jgi:hypothetical protein
MLIIYKEYITVLLMHATKTSLSAFLLTIITISSANASNEVEHFNGWTAVKDVQSAVPYCYAYTTPYRTKVYDDIRDNPYLLVTRKGKDEYSIGVSSGFLLSKDKGFTLKTNSRTHLMNIKSGQNAITFSSIQDMAILDDMIYDNRLVEVRSYTLINSKVAIDYYSLKGFIPAMRFLARCD